MSTRNPSHGQKVTDPNATNIREGAGPMASDSLAAESTKSRGTFASNRDSEPSGVAGANSTFANTNTSGATKLDPAMDAETRMAQEDWAEEKKLGATANSYPKAAGGQSKALAVENTAGSSVTGGATSSAGTAPSYVQGGYTDTAGPKGRNLTEGGFESNDKKNASFNSEIGSKNDPGRLAEQRIYRENANTGMDAIPKQKGDGGDNPYDTLGSDAQA
ncbi:hypothetical protein BJ875DRAFT_457144 [Amylocarpus encephaloides]|uniref:Uncharacterized protein n=1 Tax=Amylocarpus encephaloides TaxID=45428 RepID=A0A9P8C7D3_9HELO|nr:hypothetical protein BJ875DRAFT_457144 [Amylocarpus encephaloides]